jgi:hypothetical protein
VVYRESEVGAMRGFLRWIVMTVVVGMTGALLWAEDKPAAPERVTWSAEVAGVLKNVDKNNLTIQVDVPGVKQGNNKNNAQRGKGNNRKKGNNQARPNIQIQHKDFDLPVADHLVVRLVQPASAFDDKGNIKKYTAKELQEMKGPGNLPGYRADRADLAVGQIVKLYLAPPKGGAKAEVVMVMIVAQPQGPVKGQQRKK